MAVDYRRKPESLAIAHCSQQLRKRQFLQFADLVWLEPKLGHEHFCALLGVGFGSLLQRGAAFDDGFMEQALCGRHGEQGTNFTASAGLAENRDVGGVASETGNVIADPYERCGDVEQADVAGVHEFRTRGAEIKVPEDIQAVIDADHGDISSAREISAVVTERSAGAVGIAAAMNPNHDRPLAAVVDAVAENVKDQAVLALLRVGTQPPADRAGRWRVLRR